MMLHTPPNGLTATDAAERIRQGWLSSEDLVQACLRRIDETEPTLQAWAHLDREGAIARARELDDLRRRGRPLGPLHGVPVGLKDIIDTRDMPTQRGTPIHAGRQPEQDARIVERLKEAGAVIMGKTVTTEYAFVHPNGTRNPHNPEHTPGGSSSGSAAAVAAYNVPLAIGTQTNGSVIRPASFCGVVGFKPTNGVISRAGLLQTSASLDQIGVFARSARDAALLVDVIGGYDQTDPNSYANARPDFRAGAEADAPVPPDLVWIDLPYHDRLTPDAREGMDEVLSALDGRVERVTGDAHLAGLIDVQRIIHEYEIVHHLAEDFTDHWDRISATLQPIITRGRQISEAQYQDALGVKASAEKWFESFFHDFDAVIAPSAAGEAPLFSAGGTGDPVFCTIWTLAGLPTLTLPLLTGANGLPVGVQLIGAAQQDDRLLRTARWLEHHLQYA